MQDLANVHRHLEWQTLQNTSLYVYFLKFAILRFSKRLPTFLHQDVEKQTEMEISKGFKKKRKKAFPSGWH